MKPTLPLLDNYGQAMSCILYVSTAVRAAGQVHPEKFIPANGGLLSPIEPTRFPPM
jgi:hypothetical protein